MTDIELLKEEIFCLNYELRILAGFVNYGRLERWIKNYTDKVTEHSHIQRYELAAGFVATAGKLPAAAAKYAPLTRLAAWVQKKTTHTFGPSVISALC